MRPALFNIITARVPEADLLIDTMTVRPQGNRAFLISDTIRRLKAADIWAKLDVLWMLAAHDAQAGRLNWKAPASFALTAVNSPTFTTDRGYAGNGTTSYLNTGFTPSTHGVNYTLNNMHMSGWDRTSRAAATRVLFGATSAGTQTVLLPRWTSNLFFARINESGSTGDSVSDSQGWFSSSRSTTPAFSKYRNAVSIGTPSQATVSVPTVSFFMLADNNSGTPANLSTDEIAQMSLGGHLTAAQMSAYYSILQSHMVAVGAA